jgi:hypothetical protein
VLLQPLRTRDPDELAGGSAGGTFAAGSSAAGRSGANSSSFSSEGPTTT